MSHLSIVKNLIIITTLTIASAAHAADINITRTVSNETAYENFGYINEISETTIDTNNILTADFNTLSDTTIELNITAPIGKRFHVIGHDFGNLSFRIHHNLNTLWSDPTTFINTSTSTLNGFQGILADNAHATDNYFGNSGNTGYSTDTYFQLTSGDDFYFDSITILFTIPASFSTDFSNSSPQTITTTVLAYADPGYDPGQFLSLVAVPEPASISLLALSLLALTRRK
ncbi:PEP-CTERM sorting domain-containing protein [Planctomycetota bacterium]|nr:PEP-CTERM sorting domain-containing protein [Planctomycetota bacterium]